MARTPAELIAAHEAGRHQRYLVHDCALCPRCEATAWHPTAARNVHCGRVLKHSGNHVTGPDEPPLIW